MVVMCAAALMALVALSGQTPGVDAQKVDMSGIMETVAKKVNLTLAEQVANGPATYPHMSNVELTEWEFVPASSWVSGFFPGMMWYLNEYQRKNGNQAAADQLESDLNKVQLTPELFKESLNSGTHDVGFKIVPSFGYQYVFTKNSTGKEALLNGAKSLASRFNPTVGLIKSWDTAKYQPYPVITDNLINLELLFYVAQEFGIKEYYDIAVSHLDRTATDLIRPNGCAWHRANYDPATGKLLGVTGTPQGLESPNTIWTRGQAWVIYGYTMAYRYTNNKKYLNIAHKAATCFLDQLKSAGIKDFVPPFDFAATGADRELKDTSATAIVASAFAELDQWGNFAGTDYGKTAAQMVNSLYQNYGAPDSVPFILLDGESHFQQGKHERGLIYGDYYFLEAVLRLAKKTGYLGKNL